MSWSDPIADMLTRIRNAQKAKLPEVAIPASKIKAEIARVFLDAGFIAALDEETPRELKLTLKYTPDGEAVIRGLRRDSRPGLRKYVAAGKIPLVLGGMGVNVISTSNGIMSGRDARKRNVGGEILCSIW